ncbi:MAG: hypothetical protein AAGI34_03845 [Pseudomonadota bacterium]
MNPFDFDALRQARLKARRRMPNGARMTRFRWAEIEGAVWMFPAALTTPRDMAALCHESPCLADPEAHPLDAAFWLATAVRQDLWRALRPVPGLVPVVRARPGPEPDLAQLRASALVSPHLKGPALLAVIRDLFQPDRLSAWSAWASAKARRAAN